MQNLRYRNMMIELRQNIESLNIKHEKNAASPYLTVSMGFVRKNAALIAKMDTIYKECDDLLYEAKRRGRNRVVSNL